MIFSFLDQLTYSLGIILICLYFYGTNIPIDEPKKAEDFAIFTFVIFIGFISSLLAKIVEAMVL